MNKEDIAAMLRGIDNRTLDVIVRQRRQQFHDVIVAVNRATARENICPRPDLVLNAFRLCGIDRTRVVIFGQDPYPDARAQGLSFSVAPDTSIPRSLIKIFECLIHCGLMREMPPHGDLSSWASQGVLLINSALTCARGVPSSHKNEWREYIDSLIGALSELPRKIIFILLGDAAKSRAHNIGAHHYIFTWGHPSPLNADNRNDNPRNFKYCDAFIRANDALIAAGEPPVVWEIDVPNIREVGPRDPTPSTYSTLWIFTDGGSLKNGRPGCTASWAYYITDGNSAYSASGAVVPCDIPGKVYRTSNNRGELTAIYNGLTFINRYAHKFGYDNIVVVSDTEYSIKAIEERVATWIANGVLADKKNIDIILPTKRLVDLIRMVTPLRFMHVRSHRAPPADDTSEEWFIWRGNDIVDKMCSDVLNAPA